MVEVERRERGTGERRRRRKKREDVGEVGGVEEAVGETEVDTRAEK